MVACQMFLQIADRRVSLLKIPDVGRDGSDFVISKHNLAYLTYSDIFQHIWAESILTGGEECVLHNLWKCAADGVFDGSGDLDERIGVATQAANVARQLISISTDFCHLYYDAISVSLYYRVARVFDEVTQAVNLFRPVTTHRDLHFRCNYGVKQLRAHSQGA